MLLKLQSRTARLLSFRDEPTLRRFCTHCGPMFYLVFIFFLTTVMHIISVTDFPLFCSNSARKCLILPAECSPQKSLVLFAILPAEFIQACLSPPQRPPTVRLDRTLGKKRAGAGKREKLKRPGSRFLSPALPLHSLFLSLVFTNWCLLTGASAEERASLLWQRRKHQCTCRTTEMYIRDFN